MYALDVKAGGQRIVRLYQTAEEVVGAARKGCTICTVPDHLCSNSGQRWTTSGPLLDYIDALPASEKTVI